MINRNILCIDLKSFFASCECVERGLDPFKYPLVVANKNQGGGAITLAVTPYLKTLGVPSRGRIYEIKKDIKYEIVNPRMQLYINKSKEVISIYLNYIDNKDLHIYSIDECFLDVTNYLKLYKKTPYELAKEILNTIYEKTGLTATCGIGPNMLLAKVSMDIEAKHNASNIAKWDYEDVTNKLWSITPLSKMWGIGSRMEYHLNKLQIFSVGDLAKYNPHKLKDKFGIIGFELWQHANGIDNSIISDFKNNVIKDKSYSNSQILFRDYVGDEIKLIISEMVDVVVSRLRRNHKVSRCIGLGIGYSKSVGGGFYHAINLDNPTDIVKDILAICNLIFDKYYDDLPIRKVSVSCSRITSKVGVQLSLFDDLANNDDLKINTVIDEIKEKYGKNSILKASSLLDYSTIIMRNKKIGGHNE